jgi:UDP:flavonoid glycosyltransferase YjiC (YdhE family)
MLFTCRPLTGHLQPLLPLANLASQRGHLVTFAVAEPIASTLQSAGFHVEIAGLSAQEGRVEDNPEFRELPRNQMRQFMFSKHYPLTELPPRLADLERINAMFKPNVIVHEIAELAAPLAGMKATCPWVTVGFGPLLQPDVANLAANAVAPQWRREGFAPLPWAGLYRHLYVDPYPPSLQIPEIAELAAVIGLRPPVNAADRATLAQNERNGLYLTFGTLWHVEPGSTEIMRLAVEGCADAGMPVTVTVGRDFDASLLGSLPPAATVAAFIPQDELLSKCRAMVSHAGANTLLGALAWGVPSLLLPQRADQFYNADRAAKAGVSRVILPPNLSRVAIAEGVRSLLADTELGMRVSQVRDEIAALPSIETAMDRIEALGNAAKILSAPYSRWDQVPPAASFFESAASAARPRRQLEVFRPVRPRHSCDCDPTP